MKAFGISDTGRVRPSNEDQFLIAELTKTMRIWQTSLPEPKAQFGNDRGHLFLVAQITHDHTVPEDMVRRGELQPEQVAQHPLRHVITNVVGGSEASVYVKAHALGVQASDRLLLCSDGLTEMVTNEDDRT